MCPPLWSLSLQTPQKTCSDKGALSDWESISFMWEIWSGRRSERYILTSIQIHNVINVVNVYLLFFLGDTSRLRRESQKIGKIIIKSIRWSFRDRKSPDPSRNKKHKTRESEDSMIMVYVGHVFVCTCVCVSRWKTEFVQRYKIVLRPFPSLGGGQDWTHLFFSVDKNRNKTTT